MVVEAALNLVHFAERLLNGHAPIPGLPSTSREGDASDGEGPNREREEERQNPLRLLANCRKREQCSERRGAYPGCGIARHLQPSNWFWDTADKALKALPLGYR